MPKDGGGEKVEKKGGARIKPTLSDEALKKYQGRQNDEQIFKQFNGVFEASAPSRINRAFELGKEWTNRRSKPITKRRKRILTTRDPSDRSAAGPRGEFRAAVGSRKAKRLFTGFDDEMIAVYAGDDGAGDPRLLGGDVLGDGLPRSNFPGHRYGDEGRSGVAEPTIGAALLGGVFPCAKNRNPRRRDGQNKAVYLALGSASRRK
jgi:hypothetical protein